MLKNLLLSFCVVTFLFSCHSKVNQYVRTGDKVQKRNGKWVEDYSSSDGELIAVGKYKIGEKVGVWKTSLSGKKYQKDKIKNDITYTKFYFPNGKIMEQGQSKLEITDSYRHWFYFGDWKYYGENGKLKYIKKYADGKKVDSISFMK